MNVDERPYYERFDGAVRVKMPPLVAQAIVGQTLGRILETFRRDYPGGNVVPDFAPEIAVEVRSPGVSAADLEKKIAKYLACGTTLVLDVDAEARTIHARSAEGELTFRIGESLEYAAFPWLRFGVAEAFANLDRFTRLVEQ